MDGGGGVMIKTFPYANPNFLVAKHSRNFPKLWLINQKHLKMIKEEFLLRFMQRLSTWCSSDAHGIFTCYDRHNIFIIMISKMLKVLFFSIRNMQNDISRFNTIILINNYFKHNFYMIKS